MIWLLGGYIWLYVHRPFEIWPSLATLQLERAYMLGMILVWAVSPAKKLAANRIHAALALFTLVLLGSWLLSPYSDKPGATEVVDNYCKVLVFYVLVVTSVRDAKGLRLLTMLFLGAVGLYMAHSMWEFMHGRYQWRQGTRRMMGVDLTYSDPNAFASTLLFPLPLILPFFREAPRRVPRIILLGYVGSVIGCILLTGSRAGFVGLTFLGVLLVVMSARHKVRAIVGCGVAGVVAMGVLSVVLPDDLQNRYLTLVDSSRGPKNAQLSADGRLDGFLWGVHVWQRSPLIGYGPASFAYSTQRGGQAHNLYGQVLSELGLAGVGVLGGLLWCFWRNWRDAQRIAPVPSPNDFAYHLSRAIVIAVALLLVMGWAGHNLFRYNWQWLAAFSAVAGCCLRQRAEVSQACELEYGHPGLQLQG